MTTRLVVPSGAKADDLSWIERDGQPITWAQVAEENGVQVEPNGSEWCVANGIDVGAGYGIVSAGD